MAEGTNTTTPQPNAAPAPVAPVAPAAPVVAAPMTAITFPGFNNGQPTEISSINAQQGAALYGLLPPTAKQDADNLEQLARNFRSAYDIRVPEGTTVAGLFSSYFDFLRSGHGVIGADAPQAIKDLDRAVGGQLRALPVARQLMQAQDVVEGGGTAWDSFKHTVMLLPNMLGATITAGGDVLHMVGADISQEQAHTFGAVYAAATYNQGAARRAAPFIAFPEFLGGQPSQLFSNFGTYISATADWAAHLPWVFNSWSVITNWLIPFIRHIFDNTVQVPSLSDAWNQGQRELDQRNAAGDTSISGLVEGRLRGPDRQAAAGQMVAAGSVDGVNTGTLAPLAAFGGEYVNRDGNIHNYNVGSGIPTDTILRDAQGNPQTPLTRARDNLTRPLDYLIQGVQDHPLATAIGVLPGAQLVRGVAEGTARQFAGPRAADTAATRAEAAAQAAREELARARAAAEGTAERSRWRFWERRTPMPTPEDIARMEGNVTTAEAEAARTSAAAAEARTAAAGTRFGRFAAAAADSTAAADTGILNRIWQAPRRLGRMVGDFFGFTGSHAASAPGTIASRASTLAGETASLPSRIMSRLSRAGTGFTTAIGEGRYLGAVGELLGPIGSASRAVLGRAGEVGAVLMAADDVKDTYNQATTGNTRGAVRGSGNVIGGVGGTLLAGGWFAAAIAGGELGAEGGAAVGAVGGAGVGAVPGAVIGFLGGVAVATAGYFGGRYLMGNAAEAGYDALNPNARAQEEALHRAEAMRLQAAAASTQADPGIQAAVSDTDARTRAQRLAFAAVRDTNLGSLQRPEGPPAPAPAQLTHHVFV